MQHDVSIVDSGLLKTSSSFGDVQELKISRIKQKKARFMKRALNEAVSALFSS
jgi:hypothetical protein